MSELRVTPKQERSTARLDKIREAAREAIDTYGAERFTTNHVAVLAGCSIGTVYRYFPDRVAILDEILPDRHKSQEKLDEIRLAAIEARVDGLSIDPQFLLSVIDSAND